MADKSIIASDGSVWRPQGGLSRRYENVLTGETLSRRQFDRRYGALAKAGLRSYEQKAKLSSPELRASRPAIGRPSKNKISGLRPLTSKKSREVKMPFHVFYSDIGQVFLDAQEYSTEYYNNVKAAQNNSRIWAVMIKVSGQNRDGNAKTISLTFLTRPHSLPDYPQILYRLVELGYVGDEYSSMDWHISFLDTSIKVSTRKEMIQRRKKLNKRRK